MIILSNYLPYIILIFIMMALSFFFSGSETAILTSSRIHLEHQMKKGNTSAQRALSIVDNIEDSVSMLLIGNNIVNIAASAFITFLAAEAFRVNEPELFIVTAVETVIFLLLCEVTPKVVARSNAESFLMICSYPILLMKFIMKPAIKFSLVVSAVLKKTLKISDTKRTIIRSREEIDTLFKIGEEEGIINEEHQLFVSEILTFKDITAREIMTPTIDIISVEIKQTMRELVDLFVTTRFSRIPVYEGRVDNIVGYVFYRDILKHKTVKKISDVMNKVHYVPVTKLIVELYGEMVDNLIPMVFIVNEYGAVVGMVTHEDIAEEVVGEIQTSDQAETDIIIEAAKGKYVVNGNVDIEYFMRRFKVPIMKKGFETLAGFVAYQMGRIPKKGDRFEYDKFIFIIDEATDRSVEKVIVQYRKKRKRKNN